MNEIKEEKILIKENYPVLDEFYYALETAIEDRSLALEGLEGLEHLNLNENTDDPYLQSVYLKHGLFGTLNLKKAFQLFHDIKDGMIKYEPWKTMKIPINAFVCNQLSLFYLGFHGVTERNVELSEIYLKESIELGNRMAMESRAEELLQEDDIENQKLHNAIDLFKKAISLGHKGCQVSLIECYKLSEQYSEVIEQYEQLINVLGFENYLDVFIRDFKRIYITCEEIDREQLTKQFITILLKSKPSKVLHLHMIDISNLITEDILDKIILEGISNDGLDPSVDDDQPSRLIENILFIFTCNSLLYKKYMTKLLKYFNICSKIKECLKNSS